MPFQTLSWLPEGILKCLDQRKLPVSTEYICCATREMVFEAIQTLAVRGAPAIGIAGAYGLCVDLFHNPASSLPILKLRFNDTAAYLKSSRPTAVNLSWAIDRMKKVSEEYAEGNPLGFRERLLQEARRIHEEDAQMCAAIGKVGSGLVQDGMNILTHCNAGRLATGGDGTALAVLYQALREGKRFSVYADETRPLLQGARLTAYELQEAGIPTTLICDNMAGYLMKQGKIHLVITGADRIARNGDTANKIGTFSVARLARSFNIPFYIAAPSSTFDFNSESEKDIVIEERSPQEVVQGFGRQTAPSGISVYNPAFDVTESSLINGFITEKGILTPPFDRQIFS